MPIIEGKLIFNFDCEAIKFDESTFYRKHFSRMINGIKAVDILAVNKEIGYLIEIKDYTAPNTNNLTMKELRFCAQKLGQKKPDRTLIVLIVMIYAD
ncbi:MAG: hypothetical protein DRR16_08580 [Candidatus Parabeggiatoa sp. nov. 3]|nr:MAG: hypothetical protein DRR00_15255 [Gammaproteobacteria bacterium]RKZ62454.1 MAG: hypothetical protein DRQ99_18715 [Gammaproteobacteria bacterium]RKZ86885.1 MAG: hypothetical protein DRR16_08580 [Gammaproteobacteria bacterium]